jgi:hypothetical protein
MRKATSNSTAGAKENAIIAEAEEAEAGCQQEEDSLPVSGS